MFGEAEKAFLVLLPGSLDKSHSIFALPSENLASSDLPAAASILFVIAHALRSGPRRRSGFKFSKWAEECLHAKVTDSGLRNHKDTPSGWHLQACRGRSLINEVGHLVRLQLPKLIEEALHCPLQFLQQSCVMLPKPVIQDKQVLSADKGYYILLGTPRGPILGG